MKYLLIEDDPNKVQKISEFISRKDSEARITASDHLSDARRKILTHEYDLIVFDIFLPLTTGGASKMCQRKLLVTSQRAETIMQKRLRLQNTQIRHWPTQRYSTITV